MGRHPGRKDSLAVTRRGAGKYAVCFFVTCLNYLLLLNIPGMGSGGLSLA